MRRRDRHEAIRRAEIRRLRTRALRLAERVFRPYGLRAFVWPGIVTGDRRGHIAIGVKAAYLPGNRRSRRMLDALHQHPTAIFADWVRLPNVLTWRPDGVGFFVSRQEKRRDLRSYLDRLADFGEMPF